MPDLRLGMQYRSDGNVIARDLYDRSLPEATSYSRAVGFFSPSCFRAAPEAFQNFFQRGGYMRVVCSPCFSRSDLDLLYRAYRDAPTILKRGLATLLPFFESDASTRDAVAWLIAAHRIEIKIAVLQDRSTKHIYHEKLGLFSDGKNRVAFTGSANESLSGLRHNFELVDLFRSWVPSESRRVERKEADFNALWGEATPKLDVCPFPEAANRGLMRLIHDDSREYPLPVAAESDESVQLPGIEETLAVPGDLVLKEHQRRAIREWMAADGRGIYEMATGSGKTIAALATAALLYTALTRPLFIVIVCPYLHLVTQWIQVAKRFGLDPLPCAVGRNRWAEDFALRVYNVSVGTRPLASVVVTNATFASAPFQKILSQLPQPAMLIADEVHNLGSANLRRSLPLPIKYRLGLSATPERWFDEEGTASLYDYFGPALVHYTLEQALEDRVLCPYKYYPVLVELTDSESQDYYELTAKIGRQSSIDSDSASNELLQALLIRRARIVATAEKKIPALRALLTRKTDSTHNLIYCGDGTVESAPAPSVTKQLDAVTQMLGLDLHMRAARYHAETPLSRREQLRIDFASGEIQCLVAIRCLDEGVDIPEVRRAYILASSSNPRQFIQRRGRVLRRAPGKDLAEIYDFIALPPADLADSSSPYFAMNRTLLRKELTRTIQFAKSAVNGPEALNELLPLRDQFNLLDVF